MNPDDKLLELARQELTDRQYEIWVAIVIQGTSQRATAYHHDRARTTVNDTIDAANRRLRAKGVRFTQDGKPYLEENG